MRLKRLDQQVVVITGASSGIGRAAALRFAQRGAMVVCSARGERGLQTLVEEIRRKGGVAIAAPGDVANIDQMRAVAAKAVEEYGRIDTWVHVAAVGAFSAFESLEPTEIRRVLEVNLLGQMHGALAALPHIRREGRGALIHVTSVAARVGLPLLCAYSASKHGVVGFLDSLRMELVKEGVAISVTNVMPSSMDTPLFSTALTRLGVMPRPVAPVYDPELCARALVYAAEHPTRDLAVGGVGALLLGAARVSPRLVDAVMRRIAFEGQKTQIPKAGNAPNDMFEPSPPELDKIHGEFGAEAIEMSPVALIQESAAYRLGEAAVEGAAEVLAAAVASAWALMFQRGWLAEARLARRTIVPI